jgi:DUF4097 and DUF4098 domain-containing protein YvlB
MKLSTLSAALLLALVASPLAFAATPISESRPLAADGSVRVENIKGRIVVRTGARPEVRITGSLGKGAEKLLVDGDARTLHIEVKYPERNWTGWSGRGDKTEPTILELTIPARASLDVDSVSADVDVQQMAGRRLSVDSVSGNVVVVASSPGEARFENVSGDTVLKLTTNKLGAESVSGDLRVQGGLKGEVSLESVSGQISLDAPALSRLEVSTVSGDARLHAAMAPGAVVKAETVSGDIDLTLPKTTGAKLHVESFSGDISSPVGHVDREEVGPGSSLDARLDGGQGEIRLESFSGNIRLQLD